jgi:hypothetical protein
MLAREGRAARGRVRYLSPLASKSSSELEVLGLDGDSLGVNGAQVGVLEEGDKVCLRCFLESHDGAGEGVTDRTAGEKVS